MRSRWGPEGDGLRDHGHTTASPTPAPSRHSSGCSPARYLRARRKEGFISVIAGFSFLGIMLGVATLIIVMAVMNGFRHDLFEKILGLNGHVIVHKIGEPFADYDTIIPKLAEVPGVKGVLPIIEGQVMVSSAVQALGGLVRGMSEKSIKSLPLVAAEHPLRHARRLRRADGIAIGMRLAASLRVNVGDSITVISPRGASTPFGTSPRTKPYVIAADVRTRHVGIRQERHLHAAGRGAEVLQQGRRGGCPRGGDRRSGEGRGVLRKVCARPAGQRFTRRTGCSATKRSPRCWRSSAT